MKYVLIIGAKSDIAKELAKLYAKNGFGIYLAGRGVSADQANDLAIRYGASVQIKEFDISAFDTHKSFFDSLVPKPFGVVVASGYMADQNLCESDFDEALNTINVNYTGAVSILNIIANDMERKKEGFIVGISSVAGDRGRKTNYIYGSSKAGFSAYLSGLRNRLFASGVRVLTVKPGFVDTQMTAGLELPAKLTASSEKAALDIFVAQQKGRNTLYTKPIWWLIMLIIKHIPENIFKKMSI